jgi:hypothetical protein
VEQKPKRKSPKPRQSAEHLASDKRTAQFVAARLCEVQEQLSDLLPDLRSLEHYWDLEELTWCMWKLQVVKEKYRKFADRGTWEE